jgi:hypothetical protein
MIFWESIVPKMLKLNKRMVESLLMSVTLESIRDLDNRKFDISMGMKPNMHGFKKMKWN